jgi:hypothetical protein
MRHDKYRISRHVNRDVQKWKYLARILYPDGRILQSVCEINVRRINRITCFKEILIDLILCVNNI